jgi:hypothetical protein
LLSPILDERKGNNMKAKKTKKTQRGSGTNIANNTFIGVQFDANTIEAINTIARALENLTRVFRMNEVHIGSMLTINEEKGDE